MKSSSEDFDAWLSDRRDPTLSLKAAWDAATERAVERVRTLGPLMIVEALVERIQEGT